MQKGWLCSLAYILSWAPGSLRAEWDSKRTCKAERLPAFFQLPFIFPSWCLKSCYLHRPALKGPTEMCKKILAFVFPMPLWRRTACSCANTSMLPTSWNLPSWRLHCQAFTQRKEIVNFQNSSIDLQGSRIESNLVICGFRQREVSPHCLCLQEKCTRRYPPLLTPVNSGEMFLSLKMTLH